MTHLNSLALQVVADAPADIRDDKIALIKELRQRDGQLRKLREYLDAIDWALTCPAAADLPEGSIVATLRAAVFKNGAQGPWSSTGTLFRNWSDDEVDQMLRNGLATVLRVGYGSPATAATTTVVVSSTEMVWAARYANYDGTARIVTGDDEEHARFVVECVLTHLASLSEPTRELGGVETCQPVSRTVTHYTDGSAHYTAWTVTDNQPEPVKEES